MRAIIFADGIDKISFIPITGQEGMEYMLHIKLGNKYKTLHPSAKNE